MLRDRRGQLQTVAPYQSTVQRHERPRVQFTVVFGGLHVVIALNSLLLVYSFTKMPSVARLYFELSICPL